MASGENSLTSSVAEYESFLLLISCAMTVQLKRNQPIIRAIKKKGWQKRGKIKPTNFPTTSKRVLK